MQSPLAVLTEKEHQVFAHKVGHAIQNFGAIEFLANHMLELLVLNQVLYRTIVEQSISRRLSVLEKLLLRVQPKISLNANELTALFSRIRAVFKERNKIAHNPFVAEELPTAPGSTAPSLRFGILVIRYHDYGTEDEWIDLPALETCIRNSPSVQEELAVLSFTLETPAHSPQL